MDQQAYLLIVYGTLAISAAIPAAILWLYRKVYRFQYVQLWCAAFASLLLANVFSGLAVLQIDAMSSAHPARVSFSVLSAVFGYLYLSHLVQGLWLAGTDRRRISRAALIFTFCVVVFFSVALVLPYTFTPGAVEERVFLRVTVRNLLTGLVAFGAATWLVRRPTWRTALGANIVSMSMVVYGASHLGIGILSWIQISLQVSYPFSGYVIIFDVAAQFAIGLGLIIWLLEAERKRSGRAGQEAEFQRTHDLLTRLPNREKVLQRLTKLIGRSTPQTTQIIILQVGLDRFKQINSTFGREAGDEILRQVGDRLRGLPATGGLVGRAQGDEFILIQPEKQDPSASHGFATRILQAVGEPYALGPREVRVDVSGGVSTWPIDGTDAELLLRQADLAMQRVKSQGGRNLGYYSPELEQRAKHRFRIENDLRQALESDQLTLEYQPIISADTLTLSGVEALVRWDHPKFGLMMPNDFLPQAREIKLIEAIDAFALRRAAVDAAAWRQWVNSEFIVAVNFSAESFHSDSMIESIEQAADLEFQSPFRLEVEITEQTVIQDVARTARLVDELNRRRVSIAMDDFGSGYSSLGYLQELGTPVIKLDRAFVGRFPDDEDAVAIVEAVVPMLKRLRRTVVAEGIANPVQVEFLRRLGVDYLQGFHFFRPMAADQIGQLLREAQLSAVQGVR